MLKRTWIILMVLFVVGLMALPALADHEAQVCPDTIDGDDDNEHPSGKDRHCESGGSGTQGKAESDPDGNSNDGVDQAGGTGGDDHADQDGNNGCGNDDDFEDDNNGWCGGKPKPSGGQGEGGQVEVQGQADTTGKGAEVEGTTQVQGRADEAPNEVRSAGTADSVTQVLGESLVRTAAPTVVLGVEFVRGQTLAVTGTPAGVLALIALTMIGFGAVLVRASRVTV